MRAENGMERGTCWPSPLVYPGGTAGMNPAAHARQAATLLEVLVAIFIMGIGLLAILTLFPLGALTMARALQDDRCAHSAANSYAFATAKRPWESMTPGTNPLLSNGSGDLNKPSDPVYIDAFGQNLSPGSNVGGASGVIPRRTVTYANTTQNILKWFANLDDMLFDTDGLPRRFPAGSGPFEREVRYTFAYMCRRPKASDADFVELTIVVYNRRPMTLTPGLTLDEERFPTDSGANPARQVTYNPNSGTVTIKYSGSPPAVRPGDWILDDTLADPTNTKYQHAFFNRVVSVTDLSSNQVELELQSPIRGFPAPAGTLPSLVVLDGVAEVFEKGLVQRR
jgi:hypothetical protein